ncbi:MAG: class I SAM-dependent methyltransferase [Patescibacteria group bacterium]|nr:class I SAM-dependent methyltransferase [Patescibacteria group bacterium]
MKNDELEIDKIYDKTAKKYRDERSSKGTIHNTYIANPAIRTMLQDVRDKRLLDIGCGYGEDLKYFYNLGAEVIGIELNGELINLAKQDPELKDVEIFQGSIYSLNFKKSFDICLANLVLDQVKDLDQALREVNKVLKNGGIFVFSVAHPLNCATNNYQEQLSDYFTTRKGYFHPTSMTCSIPYYYRNFEDYSKTFFNAGFFIKKIVEPKPLPEAKTIFLEKFERFSKLPDILIFELIKYKSFNNGSDNLHPGD